MCFQCSSVYDLTECCSSFFRDLRQHLYLGASPALCLVLVPARLHPARCTSRSGRACAPVMSADAPLSRRQRAGGDGGAYGELDGGSMEEQALLTLKEAADSATAALALPSPESLLCTPVSGGQLLSDAVQDAQWQLTQALQGWTATLRLTVAPELQQEEDEDEEEEEGEPLSLLDVALEEGFEKAEALNCMDRLAGLYGLPAEQLTAHECGDLLLQALTEERAAPGTKFVKEAGGEGGGSLPSQQRANLRRRRRSRRNAAFGSSGIDTEASGRSAARDGAAAAAEEEPSRTMRHLDGAGRTSARGAVDLLLLLTCVTALLGGLLLLRRGAGTGMALTDHLARRLAAPSSWAFAPRTTPVFLAAADGDAPRLRALLAAARDGAAAARYPSPSAPAAPAHLAAAVAAVAQEGASRGGAWQLGGAASPVGVAAASGHNAALSALLAAGAQPHAGFRVGPSFAPMMRVSPLAAATMRGHATAVAALLQAGCDADEGVVMLGGWASQVSPLALALTRGDSQTAAALLRGGASLMRCGRVGAAHASCAAVAAVAPMAGPGGVGGRAACTSLVDSWAGKPSATSLPRHRGASTQAPPQRAAPTAAQAAQQRGNTAAAAAAAGRAAAAEVEAGRAAAARRRDADRAQAEVILAAKRAADVANDAAVRRAAEAELAELEAQRLALVAAEESMAAAVERALDT